MKTKQTAAKATLTVIALICTLLALFPLVWVILAGFKEKTEVLATPFRFLPRQWLSVNYADIVKDAAFQETMLTTFGGALLFAVLCLAVNAAAAYVFARLEFRFKTFLWLYVISTMFIPSMAILLTSFIVVNKLGMLDTFAVLVLPGVASAGSMFFIRQFYLNIPLALEEAALIDGADRMRIFTSIFVPMSYPVFVIVGIGAYLGYWNSFVWPTMTITNPHLFQIMQYLATFRSERSTELGMLMAGSALSAIPTIVLFLIFQKYIIAGVKISGLK
ncbi:multiple sugar transport system permease protein [Paenibacillus sp. UNC496MF]|uniref:carbohydrate ABC transporter permease n=1 Tax=Paenibacillus sp. UNC496MF TaxID=1502753 RepID=UPI0008F199DD|nr:carbohydrate ABC transporter permease [Paenibacillus sp. UNC496MF]SFI29292.1 multiple sugar transport system permease protein [Paenibacillus sp. UNC496MF]